MTRAFILGLDDVVRTDPDLVCGAYLPDPAVVWELEEPGRATTMPGPPAALATPTAPAIDELPDLPPLAHHKGLTPEQEVRKLRWELSMCEDSVAFHKKHAELAEREVRPLRDHLMQACHVASRRGVELDKAERERALLEWFIGGQLVTQSDFYVGYYKVRRRR